MLKRNLLTSLILYEKVRTTKKRAQVVGPMIDGLVALAKRASPMKAIRELQRVVTDENASRKIMEIFVHRFAGVSSGLTRAVPVGARKGDGASLVDLMLVDGDLSVKAPEKTSAPKRQKKSSSSATPQK